MLRYQSQRHRRLMQESEQALSDAAESHVSSRRSRIARHVLGDNKLHQLWECRHADLVREVAEHRRRVPQVLELRKLAVSLVHRRALIDHIRWNGIAGADRDRLFSVFYGPRDSVDSMLAEHRQYMIATSSGVSADHLIDVMHDPVSNNLIRAYSAAYADFFDLYCYVALSDDHVEASALAHSLLEARQRARAIRQHLHEVRPESGPGAFDRQELLARSGRYPVLNYMVG